MPMTNVKIGRRTLWAIAVGLLALFLLGAVVGAALLDDGDRDDAPGRSTTTTSGPGSGSSGDRSDGTDGTGDPSATSSPDADPSTTGPAGPPGTEGRDFEADPLDPDGSRSAPGVPTPTTEPPECVPKPGMACVHEGDTPDD